MQNTVLIQLTFLITLFALGAAAWNWRQTVTLKKRFNDSLGGTDHNAIEKALTSYYAKVKATDAKLIELTTIHRRLAQATSLASQKISVVRFNPFGDTGGDQSFALAVLDAHNSGYVLTSMHGREGTRVYVKPIDLGKSKYTLSKEEQQALAQAAKRVPQEETNG